MAIKDRLYGVPVVGTALRIQDRYKADAADQLAASIGFFGFLSLFPLIVMAVAIGGLFLRATPGATFDVAQAIRGAIPGIEGLAGTSLENVVSDIAANAGAILGVGAITLLLSGLRVVNGAMVATTRVFRMPEPVGWRGWVRKLAALLGVGTLGVLGAVAATLIGLEIHGVAAPLRVALGLLVSFSFDLALFLVAYRMLAAGRGPAWRDLLPGAALAAAGWTALKSFGSVFVANQAANATALYGTLGGIIALLLLFYLAGRLYLYGAETSAVLRGIGAGRDALGRPARPPDDETGASDDTRAGSDVRAAAPGIDELGPLQPDPNVHLHRRRLLAAHEPTPTASAGTRARLAAADARSPQPADVRAAVAFLLAIGAVGGLVYAFKPWDD